MAENQIEFVIRARDLASQAMLQLNQTLEVLEQGAKGAGQGLQRVERGAVSTRGTISVLTRTTRFAAIGFISELDPAMGQVVARMTSLGSVAAATGSLLKGGLIVGGITLVVAALSNWVQSTNRQIEFQLQLNRTVGEFNVQGAAAQMRELVIQQEALRAKSTSGLGPVIQFWKDLFNQVTTGRTQTQELNEQFVETKRVWDRMRVREFSGQMAELAGRLEGVRQAEIQRQIATAGSAAVIASIGVALKTSIRAEEQTALTKIAIEEKAAGERLQINELHGAEATRIETEFSTKRAVVAAQTAERIAQAEKTIQDAIQRTIEMRRQEQDRMTAIAKEELTRVQRDSDFQIEEQRRVTQAAKDELEEMFQDEVAVAEKIREARKRQAEEQIAGLKDMADQASATIQGTLSETLQGFAAGQFKGFKSLWQGLWQSLTQITADAAAQIILFGSKGFGGGAGGMGGGIFGLLGTLGSSLGLTGMQKGGLVTKPTAALLHPGERVLPADQAGGGTGGVTVINLSDPEKLAAIVAQETSKGREVVLNDVIQGMRGNRAIRRGIQRFR